MAYLVFDLDATLANVASVIFILQDLTGYTWNSREVPTPLNLKDRLDAAYKLFVKKIVNLERNSETRIGILRPGILDIMEISLKLQEEGKCKGVMIYSNNSSIKGLEFIRDLIHTYLGTQNLIKDCIHRNHHFRMDPNGDYAILNNCQKTWNSLRNLLIKGKCLAPASLDKSSVLFFDDNLHPDLEINLGENYVTFPPYNYNVKWSIIEEIYNSTLEETDLLNFEFLQFIRNFNPTSPKTIQEHLYQYKMRYSLTTQDDNVKELTNPDIGIFIMIEALQDKFIPQN
jgi:hypothetical protein